MSEHGNGSESPFESEAVQRIKAVRKLTGGDTRGVWKLGDHRIIHLLTLDELESLKREVPKTKLISIEGDVCTAAEADDNTRGGYVAYGLLGDTDETDKEIA